jgi:protein TonB
MNGYKTGGDWTDVTSIARNEVVFEGRHKAYGAYYIRKRYPNALYLSFFSALTFIALCAGVSFALRNISKVIPVKDTGIIIAPTDVILHKDIITPPVTHPVKPPKSNPNTHLAPVIAQRTSIDSAPKPIVDDHTPIPNGPVTGNPNPNPDPGSGPSGNPPALPKPDQIFTWVGEMPKFPGGNVENYIGEKIRYSAKDVELGIQGTVYASFIVEKDGSVSSVKLLKGINGGPDLNEEALRVIAEMPKWIPGKQDGHPVRIQFSIPIQFRIH